jgi:hypothetical protein
MMAFVFVVGDTWGESIGIAMMILGAYLIGGESALKHQRKQAV